MQELGGARPCLDSSWTVPNTTCQLQSRESCYDHRIGGDGPAAELWQPPLPSPPNAAPSSRPPRIAVCSIGHVRTFELWEGVRASFRLNVLESLAAHGANVDLFVRIMTTETQANETRLASLTKLIADAVASPRLTHTDIAVRRGEKNNSHVPERQCVESPNLEGGSNRQQRSAYKSGCVSQLHSLHVCHTALNAKRGNATTYYDMVAVLRIDLLYPSRLPSFEHWPAGAVGQLGRSDILHVYPRKYIGALSNGWLDWKRCASHVKSVRRGVRRMACGSASVEEMMLLALSAHKVPIANCWRKDAAGKAAREAAAIEAATPNSNTTHTADGDAWWGVTPPVIWRDLSTNDAMEMTKGMAKSTNGGFNPAVREALGARRIE